MQNVLVETLINGWPLFRDISPFKAYRTFPASNAIQGLPGPHTGQSTKIGDFSDFLRVSPGEDPESGFVFRFLEYLEPAFLSPGREVIFPGELRKCDVERNCYGPTGFAEAVGGIGHLHDCFTCPHRDEDWHCYASQLIAQKYECASRRVRELIDLDLKEALTTRSVL